MPDLQPFQNRSAEHLRLAIESAEIGIWELDLKSGLAVTNATHDRIFGYDGDLAQWSYEQFLDHVVDRDKARVDELQQSAVANGREWSFECQIRTARGQYRWIKAAGRPLQASDKDVSRLIGHVIDITEIKQNEARLQLISEELNHRVRNMLATIQSMVKITARGASDIVSFSRSLEGRVGALARSHRLLVSTDAALMLPSAILREELSSFAGFETRVRIRVSDEAELGASAGQGLALVFHELLTNAIKYGALSAEDGNVEVTFDCADDVVEINWKEFGGPTVPEERGSGFGSMLIARALAADGTTEQTFEPDGVQCTIRLRVA